MTTRPCASAGRITSMTCCRRDAAKRKSSGTGSIFIAVSSRIARMRSATGVPPGSLVTRTFGIRSASFRSCVVLPEPSMPSRVMNTQPVFQAAKIMLAHQLLEHIIVRQETKSLAEPGATAQASELALVGQSARLELVHAQEVAELGMLAIED